MDIQQLTDFFMWGTIINFVILLVSVVMSITMSDFAFNLHHRIFHISKDTYHGLVYGFLALYKLLTITLFLVPYITLLIIN